MHAARFAMLLALVTAPAVVHAGAPPAVLIDCIDAVGVPGGIASVQVTLFREGEALVVGTQNDLSFDGDRFSIERGDCVINPDIGPDSPVDKELQQNVLTDPPRVRAIIVALNNVQPIPPGLLYTCPFQVGGDTPLGTYEVGNGNFVASTASGMRLPVGGSGCSIRVTAPHPSPTPRCRDDDDCPDGEVCVDGECVAATPTPRCRTNEDCPDGEVCVDGECVAATPTVTPTATPIGFCEDTDDCPPGQVCVNNMCVTVTPTPMCRVDMDCPSGQVCVDGDCVTSTPTATPTTTIGRGGGDGCNCEIDPSAPSSRMANGLAVLLPALVLLLRWRSRRAAH